MCNFVQVFKKKIVMKIVFATGNKGKLREASEILGESFELSTPADFGIVEGRELGFAEEQANQHNNGQTDQQE